MKLTYRFNRTATTKIASDVPAALQFAGELCAYIEKKYGVPVRCGCELFNDSRIHWYSENESLDKMTAVFAQMMQDREYLAMIDKSRSLWVEGSVTDRIIALLE